MTTAKTPQPSEDPDLTVIIPTHHEEENIGTLLDAISRVTASLGVVSEVVIVDVGSEDATASKAKALGARVFVQSEPGYGGALREGFRRARGRYVVTMDADLSHDPEFIQAMWELRHEADVVIASRYVEGGSAEMPRSRYLLSRLLNVAFTRVLALPLKDISSGFRMYRRDILPGLDLSSRDFDILEEILMKVYAEGYAVREVPFSYAPRQAGRSHARLFWFAISYSRTLFSMWRLRNSVFAADYDERAFHSWILPQRYWQRKRFGHIIGALGEDPGQVLDIGCGSSRIVQALRSVVGLDIQLKKLRYLRKMGKPLVRADLKKLPFLDETFDTVICSQVIEHVPMDKAIFSELARVARPGARLILGTPDYDRISWLVIEWLYARLMPGAYAEEHISHYTYEGLVEALARHGYTVTERLYIARSELILVAARAEHAKSGPNDQESRRKENQDLEP